MDYVRSRRDLIPDDLPRVGRLDDAIVIDAAWPRLADEVACYLDYCRIRRIEAELRECDVSQFTFGRADWEQARSAESAWPEHCRACGQRSDLPAPPPRHLRLCCRPWAGSSSDTAIAHLRTQVPHILLTLLSVSASTQ